VLGADLALAARRLATHQDLMKEAKDASLDGVQVWAVKQQTPVLFLVGALALAFAFCLLLFVVCCMLYLYWLFSVF
jgi:hypothetical protein